MKTSIVSNEEVNCIVESLKMIKKQIKQLKKQEDMVTQELYNYMNEHDILVDHETGLEIVNWSYSSGYMKFDAARFNEDSPELYQIYCKMTNPVRTLRITK